MRRPVLKLLLAFVGLGLAGAVVIGFLQKNHDVNSLVAFDVTPDRVWRVLNAFEAYPEWNPHLRALDGQPRPRSRTRLVEIFPDGSETIRQVGMKSMATDYEFIWEAELYLLPRLLSAKRKLIMTPSATGGTSLRHEIEFTGWLSGPLSQWQFDRYAQSMAAMNAALVARVASEK